MIRRTLAIVLLVAAPALAQEPQIYRLTPAQIDAAQAEASHRTDTDTPALLPDPNRDRILGSSLYGSDAPRDNKVHGEVSLFVGTGGARGIAATIGAPIGENAYAQFSFSQGRLPGQYFYPYGPYRPYRWDQQRR